MFGKFVKFTATAFIAASMIAVPAKAQEQKRAKAASVEIPADQKAFLDRCKSWDEWDKPAPPFKVYGNTYYVGTCGIAAILITGDNGHVLIDTGTEAGAKIVLDNVRALGLDPQDIEYLLHSHEHFDHVGGLAFIEEITGAQVYASPEAALVLILSGKPIRDDPQFGMHEPMKTVRSLKVLKGKFRGWDELTNTYILDAGLKLRAERTPGHTPGALSWQWESCEGDQCLTLVYADSLSPVSADDYKFSDHPDYVEAYHAGLERLARLDCDILLTPHPSHSRMLERMKVGKLTQNAPLEMPCRKYAEKKGRDLNARLAKEAETE